MRQGVRIDRPFTIAGGAALAVLGEGGGIQQDVDSRFSNLRLL